MNLGQLCDVLVAQGLGTAIQLPVIPVKHPQTGDKAYIRSNWSSGVWFTATPNGNKVTAFETQVSPLKFTVHPDVDVELAAFGYKPVAAPLPTSKSKTKPDARPKRPRLRRAMR